MIAYAFACALLSVAEKEWHFRFSSPMMHQKHEVPHLFFINLVQCMHQIGNCIFGAGGCHSKLPLRDLVLCNLCTALSHIKAKSCSSHVKCEVRSKLIALVRKDVRVQLQWFPSHQLWCAWQQERIELVASTHLPSMPHYPVIPTTAAPLPNACGEKLPMITACTISPYKQTEMHRQSLSLIATYRHVQQLW